MSTKMTKEQLIQAVVATGIVSENSARRRTKHHLENLLKQYHASYHETKGEGEQSLLSAEEFANGDGQEPPAGQWEETRQVWADATDKYGQPSESKGGMATAAEDSQGGMMKRSRRTLADVKGTNTQPARRSVSSEKVKQLVEETMQQSETLAEMVQRIIEEHREEIRATLGVDEDLKQLGEAVLKDIEQGFKEYAETLEEWKRNTEQKMVSKVEFNIPERPTIELENVHYAFPDLLHNAHLRLPTLLVGPSGSFKTSSAKRVSEILDLPFGYVALGPTQTEAKFAGYPDAQGHFVPTEFYLRYKYGGVIVLDELDNGNPSVLVWLNGAIQNREAAFPRGFMTRLEQDGFQQEAEELAAAGGMVPMHPDCVIVATANTFGRGADLVYQGRNALDGSTLKRFKVIVWDYDESLERKIAGDDVWVSFVQEVRAAVEDLELHHIVSPVDSIDGAYMIASGQSWRKVAHQTVFAGLQKDELDKVWHARDLSPLVGKLNEREKEQADARVQN